MLAREPFSTLQEKCATNPVDFIYLFTYQNELEASLMLSKPPVSHPHITDARRGVSVALLTRVKNPSQLVRALYVNSERNPHPFLSGSTAEEIGASLGEELVDPSYFYTERRWREHRRGLGLPEEPLPYPSDDVHEKLLPSDQLPKGTVGAVALDIRGCIAVLTSTGGRTNKLVGRIGDTPHMGSGFWAEEWKSTPKTWFRAFLDRFRRGHKPTCMGISGTGDGDVGGIAISVGAVVNKASLVLYKASHCCYHHSQGTIPRRNNPRSRETCCGGTAKIGRRGRCHYHGLGGQW